MSRRHALLARKDRLQRPTWTVESIVISPLYGLMIYSMFLAAIFIISLISYAVARPGSYDPNANDPVISQWYRTLMQPDTIGYGLGPGISCCGEGDAYYADEVRVRDGKMYAVITDTRPDPPNRMHEEPGTEYEIPKNKIVGMEQRNQGNPTGHIVIFLGVREWTDATHAKRFVLCYVPNTGV